MTQLDKALYFEYVVKKLLNWYQATTKKEILDNDLSKLKTLKLLFFVSAVNSKSSESNTLLDKVFTNFVAMPYGHVESEIYATMIEKKGKFTYFTINNEKTIPNDGVNINNLDTQINQQYKQLIDDSIQRLQTVNPKLIVLSAFQLVDISHSWYSWKKFYSTARATQNNSEEIPAAIIKQENKIFSLQVF